MTVDFRIYFTRIFDVTHYTHVPSIWEQQCVISLHPLSTLALKQSLLKMGEVSFLQICYSRSQGVYPKQYHQDCKSWHRICRLGWNHGKYNTTRRHGNWQAARTVVVPVVRRERVIAVISQRIAIWKKIKNRDANSLVESSKSLLRS